VGQGAVVFEVAGAALRLEGFEAPSPGFFDEHYPGFHRFDEESPVALTLRWSAEPGPPPVALPAPGAPPVVEVERSAEGSLATRSHAHDAQVDLAAGQGSVRFTGSSAVELRVALENLLRVAFANLLIEREACLVHAAAVVVDGGASVLFGLSGSGKSALARRAAPRPLISDDLVALRLEGDRVFVERLPFFGEFASEDRSPGSFEVLRLDALSSEGEPGLHALPRAAALARLGACLPFLSPSDPRRLELAARLLALHPARQLVPGGGDDWALLAGP
jgi:hypothetical protein